MCERRIPLCSYHGRRLWSELLTWFALTPNSATRVFPAGRVKTKCLQLMDEVDQTGEAILITKRGRPVSILAPVTSEAPGICGRYKGRVRIPDEGLPKPFTPAEWAGIVDDAMADDEE